MKSIGFLAKLLSIAGAAAIVFTSCSKERILKPFETVSEEDWHQVPQSGGVVEAGDITLEFPSGTFAGESKIAVTPVRKGSVGGDDERSQFYQLTFPDGGTKKEFTVRIPWAGEYGEVRPAVKILTFSRHLGTCHESVLYVNCSFSNGEVVVNIPPVLDPLDINPFFSIGLLAGQSAPPTKAWYPILLTSWFADESALNYTEVEYQDIMFKFPDYYRKACDDLGTLGLRPDFWTLLVRVHAFKEADEKDCVGLAESNPFVTEWGYMRLNSSFIKRVADTGYEKSLVNELRQTLVHELFHLVHDQQYDVTRSAMNRYWMGSVGDDWAMLSEAIGCWTEKVTGEGTLGDNSPFHAKELLTNFFPLGTDYATYRNHGYGMGLFIEYLAKNTSDKKIVKLVEYQRDGAKTIREVFDKFLAENKLTFFDTPSYLKFVEAVMSGEIDKRVVLGNISTRHNLDNTKEYKYREQVNDYGVTIHTFKYSDSALSSMTGEEWLVEQTQAGLLTRVYRVADNAKCFLIGTASKDAPFSLSVNDLKSYTVKYPMVVLTVRETQGNGYGAITSEVKASFSKSDPSVKVPNIWSVSLEGDIRLGGNSYASWINAGWTHNSLSTITTKKVSNGYEVHAYDNKDETYEVIFTITQKGNGFGDVVNLKYTCIYDPAKSFSLDKLTLKNFDSGKDASKGDAYWKETVPGGSMNLEVHFDRLE